MWKAYGMLNQGWAFSLTEKALDAVQTITSGLTLLRSTGSTLWMPSCLAHLARAYAELGQIDDAWRCIGEAMTLIETTKETWFEAEVHRIAGEIALKSPEPDAAKAQEYFERALTVARQQQAKSFELRASVRLAQLWRSRGSRSKLANCSLRFTAGSPRGSTRAI
jgi:predicted ATPase